MHERLGFLTQRALKLTRRSTPCCQRRACAKTSAQPSSGKFWRSGTRSQNRLNISDCPALGAGQKTITCGLGGARHTAHRPPSCDAEGGNFRLPKTPARRAQPAPSMPSRRARDLRAFSSLRRRTSIPPTPLPKPPVASPTPWALPPGTCAGAAALHSFSPRRPAPRHRFHMRHTASCCRNCHHRYRHTLALPRCRAGQGLQDGRNLLNDPGAARPGRGWHTGKALQAKPFRHCMADRRRAGLCACREPPHAQPRGAPSAARTGQAG